MSETLSPIDKGETLYDQLNPAQRDFFDCIASRLCEAEVLFTENLGAAARDSGLDWFDNQANRLLTTRKSQNILQYLNVVLGREYLGDGPQVRKRVTYFDKQFPAQELILRDNVAASDTAISEWRISVDQQHEDYVSTIENTAHRQLMLPTVETVLIPTRQRGGITVWNEHILYT